MIKLSVFITNSPVSAGSGYTLRANLNARNIVPREFLVEEKCTAGSGWVPLASMFYQPGDPRRFAAAAAASNARPQQPQDINKSSCPASPSSAIR